MGKGWGGEDEIPVNIGAVVKAAPKLLYARRNFFQSHPGSLSSGPGPVVLFVMST